jgi:imidazolonepropionase-like amidohydrolase
MAEAAVFEAHRHGKLAFTHPSDVAGLEVALDAGVDVLAHAIDATHRLSPGHFERMKRQGMALIPTLKLLASNSREEVLNQVREYSAIGGRILFGTDVGYLTDYDPQREYELLSASGLSWREVLATLTTNPVDQFSESERRGRIEPGKEGDIVVLSSDPAIDIHAFVDIRYTIRAGEVIYDSALSE